MNSRLLLLLLFRVGMGLSAPLDKSKTAAIFETLQRDTD